MFLAAAVLLGGAVAVALTGGGSGTNSTTSGHSSASGTGHAHELAHDHEPAAPDPSADDSTTHAINDAPASSSTTADHVHVLHQPDDAELTHQHLGHGAGEYATGPGRSPARAGQEGLSNLETRRTCHNLSQTHLDFSDLT